MALIKTDEKIYKVKISSFKETIKKNKFFFNTVIFSLLIIAFYYYSSIVFFNEISMNSVKLYLISTISLTSLGGLFFFSNDNSLEKLSPAIVANKEENEYQLNIGTEVREFLGNGMKSLKEENKTGRNILLHAETVKRMGAIFGTTGSGKTVQLKGMLEQQLALGGGALFVDAKGTIDELKNIYALVGKYGRLKDLYVVNFANPKNSHSINILGSGKVLMLKEMLNELIDKSDQFWDGVAGNVLENILKLMVYRRDYENLLLTFNELNLALSFPFLAAEAIRLRDEKVHKTNFDIADFINYMCISTNISPKDFLEEAESSGVITEEFLKNAKNNDIQGVYNFSTGAGRWNEIFTTLSSNYGNIFSFPEPDIDLYEIVQNNKIIIVVLPTMESEATAQKIGKLLLGLIRSVADKKIKTSFEPKIPFLFLLDEFGSFGVKGFGRFMSKARSLGLATWLYFQSEAQLDNIDDNKGMEKKEILDMCNTLVVLKVEDEQLAERLSKKVPEKVVLEHQVQKDRDYLGMNTKKDRYEDTKTTYSLDKKQAFRGSDFSTLSNGEMFVFIGGEYYKCVAQAPTDFNLTYKKYDAQVYFPLLKVFPKQKFIDEISNKDEYFDKNLFYFKKIN